MTDNKIIVGADEAGRGLIIGPMIIGACAINDSIKEELERFGIKDSKQYASYNKIKRHADFIKRVSLAWSVETLSAEVLNNFNKNGMTMDEAEAFAFFKAIEDISTRVPTIATFQVDNFQAVKKLEALLKKNKKTNEIELIVVPRAEQRFIAVRAGSILAREKTLFELEQLRKTYGDYGSGSTSDKKTILWLKKYYEKHQHWPQHIVRTFWKTIDIIEKEMER